MNLPLPILNHSPMTMGLCRDLIAKTQAPPDLIMMSILSTYSILHQGLVDVERPGVGRGPVSLFTFTIADSGERKTTVSRLLERPIADFQLVENKDYSSKLSDYEVENDIFNKKISSLNKLIAKKIKSDGCVESLKNNLIDLKKDAPTKPKKTQLIFEDITPESIAFELNQGWGNAALMSDEGATILNGRAMHDLPRLNKLWAAESFTVNRKSSPCFTVNDARLTFSIMTQPSSLSKFMKKKGEESQGIGFWARFIVCNPVSTQGMRYINENSNNGEDFYKDYQKLASDLLKRIKESNENPSFKKQVIKFSYEAKRHWIKIYNDIEASLKTGGRFQYAKDHGSKLAENIARISALLSCIEYGEDKEISLDTLMDAVNLAFYFSDHFLRFFNVLPEFVKDTIALSDYFQSLRDEGVRLIKKNKVRQSGPSRLRDKASLEQALFNLDGQGSIKPIRCASGMILIDLNPSHYLEQHHWDFFNMSHK